MIALRLSGSEALRAIRSEFNTSKIWTFALIASLFCAFSKSPMAADCPSEAVLVTTTAAPPQTPAGWVAYQQIQNGLNAWAEVIVIGDSLVFNWPASLLDRAAQGRRTANLGAPGDKTQQVLWRLQQSEVAVMQPQKVVLLVGTNNLSSKDAACAITAGIAAILNRISDIWQEPSVILVELPPRGEGLTFRVDDQQRISTDLRLLAGSRARLHVVDWSPELRSQPQAYRGDLLHFTQYGYELLTPLLARALSALPPKPRL